MPTTSTTTRKSTTARKSTATKSAGTGRTVRKAATKAPAKAATKAAPKSPAKTGKVFIPIADTPHAEFMAVTPEMAAAWLDLNEHNRSLRSDMANGWAVDMNAGDWKTNGESIKFTKSGLMFDGQHRLKGIELSSRTTNILVVWGLDEDVMSTVDIGLKRSFADVLKLRGEKNTTQLAGVTRRIFLWRRKVDKARSMKGIGIEIMEDAAKAQDGEPSNLHFIRRPGNAGYLMRGGIRPTTTQLLDLLDSSEYKAIIAATHMGMYARRTLHISAAVFGLCYWLFARLDEDDAKAFFAQVVDGESIVKGDPAFALRRAIGLMRGTYTREEVLTAMIIKAWNYWQEGIPMDVCSWKAGGRNPEAFPIPRLER